MSFLLLWAVGFASFLMVMKGISKASARSSAKRDHVRFETIERLKADERVLEESWRDDGDPEVAEALGTVRDELFRTRGF